jgi:hypothetical protein
MWRIIDNKKYLMRDIRSTKELRECYNKIIEKYPNTKLTFHQYLVQYGKVYTEK